MARLNPNLLTREEALRIFAQAEETRSDVYTIGESVVVGVGARFLAFDDLCALEKEGLISIRTEEVPHAPMGPRTPPIRHVSVTDAGREAAQEPA